MTRTLISVAVFMLSIVYATAAGPPSEAVAAATAEEAITGPWRSSWSNDAIAAKSRQAILGMPMTPLSS